jgi:hypothetical protein
MIKGRQVKTQRRDALLNARIGLRAGIRQLAHPHAHGFHTQGPDKRQIDRAYAEGHRAFEIFCRPALTRRRGLD